MSAAVNNLGMNAFNTIIETNENVKETHNTLSSPQIRPIHNTMIES